jgi:hypothetical protein
MQTKLGGARTLKVSIGYADAGSLTSKISLFSPKSPPSFARPSEHTGRKAAPRALHAGSFVDRTDFARDVARLCQIIHEIVRIPPAHVPFDLGLFRFHQDAQRHVLRFGLGELVGSELVCLPWRYFGEAETSY